MRKLRRSRGWTVPPSFEVTYNPSQSHYRPGERARTLVGLGHAGVAVQAVDVANHSWLLVPFSGNRGDDLRADWRPKLEDCGIPQAKAFCAALFGMRE